MQKLLLITILIVLSLAGSAMAQSVGTSFTYQGELQTVEASGNTPANGEFDFTFSLFDTDTGGSAIGTPFTINDVVVIDGIFTVALDFGIEPYSGGRLWLQIEVRNAAAGGAFAALTPRQPVTATPFANRTEFVAADAVSELEVLSDEVQLRVNDSCPEDSVINTINEDGSITCSTDTDAQTLTLTGAELSISDGNAVDLAAVSDDTDANNELNTAMAFDGTNLSVTDAGGSQSTDISALSNDDNNELNTAVSFDGTNLNITDAGGSQSADISALANDDNNELNTGISLSGATLTVSDAGGNQSTTLTGVNNDTNELNSGFALAGNSVSLTDAGASFSADLSSLLDNTDAQTLSLTDTSLSISGGNAVDLAALLGDGDPTNELNTALSFDGTTLSLTDAGGTRTVDLSGLSASAIDLLNQLETLDGAGSGLDADLLDGMQADDIIAALPSDNRIPISALPFFIDEPGSYYVTQDLINTTDDTNGITIDADNVTVDLGGFRLTADMGANTGPGIFNRNAISMINQFNVHIRNGHIADWDASGIAASSCENCIFENLTITGTSVGLRTGDYSLVSRVTVSFNRTAGMSVGEGTLIAHSTAQGNEGSGFINDGSSVIINCAAIENEDNGFSTSATIIASTAYQNGLHGFRLGTGSNVQQSASFENGQNGFFVISGYARDNVAARNGTSLGANQDTNGFSTNTSSYLVNNLSYANEGAGIQIRFSDNIIENNTVVDNGRSGIDSNGNGSLIIGNRASGNGPNSTTIVNYNFGTGHAGGPVIDISGVGDISAVTGADHPLANYEY